MTKSLNNLLLAANMVVASEALALAAKAGLAPEKVVAAINGSSGRSYITEYRFPNFVLKGDFSSSRRDGNVAARQRRGDRLRHRQE